MKNFAVITFDDFPETSELNLALARFSKPQTRYVDTCSDFRCMVVGEFPFSVPEAQRAFDEYFTIVTS
jgi:hypothetical protein